MLDTDLIQRVLDHGGRQVTWGIPEDAVIRPGSGESMLDGMVITSWEAQAND
ncbi:hypothetical protein ACFWAY_31335 [Rhodococcus sp. NPDC059968]|uniref:hypothetical protein n=1 Tax=Rhodococcus sp. NPDC059968 TaxID=3347017 RepID=UPI00366B09B1